MNFLLGPALSLDVRFGAGAAVEPVKVEQGKKESLPVYTSGDSVLGELVVTPPPGKKVEHQGIRVELLGQIEYVFDKSHTNDFLSLERTLAGPGEVSEALALPFEFSRVEMLHESYIGANVRLKYLLRVTVSRQYAPSIVKDFRLWVRNALPPPEINTNIKMEVGIEDCLHIEFEYQKSAYHLKDIVVGKIFFLLVRIKIKHMELEIRRRESCGSGQQALNENDTIAKFEIMDGAPVRGESIPIRLFLSPYDLTPTYPDVNKKFSVRYFINLVLVDEEDRRYFKSQEIAMYRLPPAARQAADTPAAAPATPT